MSAVKSGSASKKKSKDRSIGKPNPAINRPNRIYFNARRILFVSVLFLSGTASLIYQVLWVKQLSLVVGAEVYSVTTAVSAFFAGLAFGGAYFGRRADRLTQPFLVYPWLEAGIAVLSVATTVALCHSSSLFAAIETRASLLAWCLPFFLVGAPAFLMGGTLPIAVRFWMFGTERIAEAGGSVYASNTAGGIAGALLSTFVFLPHFGVHGTAYAAAALDLGAAAGAIALNRHSHKKQNATETLDSQALTRPAFFALTLYAIAGSVALGYEVVWSQAIVQFLSTRSFAFSIVLATYLAGLAVGSALYVRFADRLSDAWGTFGLLISAAGFIALLEIASLSIWQLRIQTIIGNVTLSATGSEFASMCTRFLIAAVGIVFVPTVLLGAAFPAALRLVTRTHAAGRDVGTVIALNTAGGIVGTLVTGFFLVPTFGLVRTLAILAITAAALGFSAVLRGSMVSSSMRWTVLAIGFVTVAIAVITPPDRMGRLLASTRGGGRLTFYKESTGSTVAVLKQVSGHHTLRRLYIQGVSNSGDAMPSLRYMRLQALLPLIIHTGEPRSALVIGFGTGITAGGLLQYPHLQTRVCAELLPAVVQAGSSFEGNFNAASDPRLQIRIRDGRKELVRSTQRYDLITLEPPPPSAAGVVNLYSSDFYKLAAKRLEPNGLIAQWLPLATQNDADTRSLMRSFLDVFPYATLWSTELHEMLLVGSMSPIELNPQEITKRFNQPTVVSSLQEVGVKSPAALLATWMMDQEGVKHYVGDAPAVTDNNPSIEYAAWVRPGAIQSVLPKLLALRTPPPVRSADSSFLSEIQEQQASLFGFYDAGIAAYNGDRDLWQATIANVLQHDHDNPYYLWVLGDDQQ
ncbi:fused MFS/spermidine synthase [Tunturiibacter lichenicola]|uniref:fused MFS/spermidine synthase n=1 Tax=Tunturiibacter lichenicola TaxID=2051959 RepID=UPI0021B1DFA4|nr:fused MFS/spermidine synthase [Edaphobacter lichenicola]